MAKRNSRNGAKLPPLPVGNSDWAEVKAGYWSADKTQLISGLLDRKSTVAVFTRPRRFGKTFAMRMLKTFFEKEKSQVPCVKELGNYGTIQNNPEIIWSLLVHTGYLKVLSGPDSKKLATVAFPNKELAQVFEDDILDPIKCVPAVGDDLRDILCALTSGSAEKFRKAVEAFLVSSASYFDTAKEAFFHGLLLGLLALGRDTFEITSNREEGDGRPDILMKPRPGVTLPGVVLELKSPKIPARASQKRIGSFLSAAAKQARKQIDAKRYAAEMEAEGIAVLKYGIGFSGKRVALA